MGQLARPWPFRPGGRTGATMVARVREQEVGSGRLEGLEVLAIAPTSFFGDYGCHVRIVEEVRALAARGVRTRVMTYPFGRDLSDVAICRAPRLPGQRQVDPGSSLQKFSLDAALATTGAWLALRERPALIHGHLHEGAAIGWGLTRLHRVPLVFDFQGSLTAEMIDHGFLRPGGRRHRLFRRVESWAVARADAIVTSTQSGAELLMREFGCPAAGITVVPDAVNTDMFRPAWEAAQADGHLSRVEELRARLGIPLGRPVVVYLGLLAEYQGITHLLQAARAVVDRSVEVHFLVMGYPGEHRYRRLAANLGLEGHVTFTGRIPYEEAPMYLALGDVAVSPKISETEGNGKLLNYVAMGLPTIAFDTAASREILGDLGIYAPRGDWSALAAEIEATLRDPVGAASRGRALRAQAVAEHRWQESVEALLDVYAGLI